MDSIRIKDGERLEPVFPLYPESMSQILQQNELILKMNTRILALATTVQYKITKESDKCS